MSAICQFKTKYILPIYKCRGYTQILLFSLLHFFYAQVLCSPAPVVWKITPLISTWFLSSSILDTTTTILELGCGISGITALSIAPKIKSYILSDQPYIMKYLHQNLLENRISQSTNSKSKKGGSSKSQSSKINETNIVTLSLDWETDDISSTLTASNVSLTEFDIILACDCIYNSHLVDPLVTTCANICKLRTSITQPSATDDNQTGNKPTICIIAQQLRSPEIFEEWLRAFMREFKVWRVGDEALIEELKTGSGFVVHFGILK